jgi:hypothetical protein
MKTILTVLVAVLCIAVFSQCEKPANQFKGTYCSGSGDTSFLRLIDESFAFFHPNPVVPNLSMVYNPAWDTFVEGAGWGGWWIQNSYGFSYSATPFLDEPWFSTLQRSWDLHWNNQGDGKRQSMWGGSPTATWFSHLVGPDGCLGDMAAPEWIAYKQGDGDQNLHEWFYEGTAAGLVMQAEILLAGRDVPTIKKYLPRMDRAAQFIERARDTINNLFLVGPACNLLAPSYGGVQLPDGSFGKGYLAGLTVTYLAALDRMVELCRLAEEPARLEMYEGWQRITRASLPLLLAPEGYFVKSVEPGGRKHGVVGQEPFGYLEGVVNADAVALRVADDQLAGSIYNRIAASPEIRPFDFLLTNAPGLDDTYWNYGNREGRGFEGFHKYGEWVNGGVWGTVEGRAILMYYRLGKFGDIRRSAERAMKWAKDFRMDAPWSQWGENTSNPWSDTGQFQEKGVAVMIDNFAIPAATIRGLFDYDYRHDRLILRPRVPGTITEYTQNQPVRFGKKQLFLTCKNGGPLVKSVRINGRKLHLDTPGEIALRYEDLPEKATVEVVTGGGWPADTTTSGYPTLPVVIPAGDTDQIDPASLPDTLKMPFRVMRKLTTLLAAEPDAAYEAAFSTTILQAIGSYHIRTTLDPGPGYFRPITGTRKEGVISFYEKSALSLYHGLVARLEKYATSDVPREQRIAGIYKQALD